MKYSKFVTKRLTKRQCNLLVSKFYVSVKTNNIEDGAESLTIVKHFYQGDFGSTINYKVSANRESFIIERYEYIVDESNNIIAEIEDMIVFNTFKSVIDFIEKDFNLIHRFSDFDI